MKEPTKKSNTAEAVNENVYNFSKKLKKQRENAEKRLTAKQFDWFNKYDQDLIISSLGTTARHSSLQMFIKIVTEYNLEDLDQVTKEQVRAMVADVMLKHGDRGRETSYSHKTKRDIKHIIRFAKTGSRLLTEDGEIDELKGIKVKTPKDNLSPEDLPTEEECKQFLRACSNVPIDKAMFGVHFEAGTRSGELLSLQIKNIIFDELGAIVFVDGKTDKRQIRITKSVPDLIKWINAHPYRDDPNHALFISTRNAKVMGNALSYHSFNARLKKYSKMAGLTKRIYSHLFRHAEITNLAGKMTEPEQRIRHGWSKSSKMPSRYTHLKNEDVDNKYLEIMGVKTKPEKIEESTVECQYCHVKHPVDTKYCETCAKPLDVIEAERLEKQHRDETQAMIEEMVRKERAEKAKRVYHEKQNKQLEEKESEIQMLKETIKKLSQAE